MLIYDTATGLSAGSVPITPNGGFAFNATGAIAYISTFSDGGSIPSITVFDTLTDQVKNVWPVPGTGPLWSMAVSPDGSTLYALDNNKNVIRIFDTASGKQTGTYSVTNSSKWLTLSPDGTQLYLVDPASTSVLAFNTYTGAISAILHTPEPSAQF
jgi:DNA-binding beta-propeller fold protein YncE